MESRTPRRSRRLASFPKKPAAAFNHEQEVGTKRKDSGDASTATPRRHVLLGSAEVQDAADVLFGGHGRFGLLEELDGFPVPVAFRMAFDDRPVLHVSELRPSGFSILER